MSDSVSDYLISDFFVNNNNNKDNDICKLLFELLNGTRKHHKLNSGSPYLQLRNVHIVNQCCLYLDTTHLVGLVHLWKYVVNHQISADHI